MATYNFEINKKPTKKGTYVVMFRITEYKKHKRIKVPFELNSIKDWNPKKQEVRQSCFGYELYNDILSNIKKEAITAAETNKANNKVNTSDSIVSTMKSGNKCFSFIQFAEEYAKATNENGNYRTYLKYSAFLNKLKYFINGINPKDTVTIPHNGKPLNKFLNKLNKDLFFNDITYSFLLKFNTYLKKLPNAHNHDLTLSNNTIDKIFDNFKSLYNKGVLQYEDEGLTIKSNPFKKFICETDDPNKEKLTIDEIEALENLQLENDTLLWHSRNCFLFAFYCAGMRCGDLLQLRGTNIKLENGNYRLCYRMDKTSSERNNLLVPEAIEILKHYIDFNNLNNDYIFPFLNSKEPYAKASTWEDKEQLPYHIKSQLLQRISNKNVRINKYLSKLALMAGIDKKISMHIARHSFANIARQKKANVYDISKALGHTSIAITESYLSKFDHVTQDETMIKVYEKDNSKDEALLNQLKSLNPEALSELLKKIKE